MERGFDQASDAAALAELGRRLGVRRLDLELTQGALAREAGVSKRTVERLEAGESAQLTNLIRVLRALGLLGRLDALVPELGPGPLELLARRRGDQRRRAPRADRADAAPASGWSWGDDDANDSDDSQDADDRGAEPSR